MICKHCGKEVGDEAVFCKFCGSRMDGMINCPVCGKEIDGDSEFCMYCGTELAEKPVKNNFTTAFASKTNLMQTITVSVSIIIALITLIFVFFAGINFVIVSQDETVRHGYDVFYYFGDAYKEYKQLIELYENNFASAGISGLFQAGELIPIILGTVFSVLSLAGVCICSVIAFVRAVQFFSGSNVKSGENFAFISYGCYIFGVAALLTISAHSSSQSGYDYAVEINAATIAGIVLGTIAVFAWLGLKIVGNYKVILNQQNIPRLASNVAIIVISIIALSLLTLPIIRLTNEDYSANVNVLNLINSVTVNCITVAQAEMVENGAVVFCLGILSYLLMLATLISLGLTVIYRVKALWSEKDDGIIKKLNFVPAPFALVHLIITIVFTKQYSTAMSNFSTSVADISFGFGIPIAVLVLTLITTVLSVIKFKMQPMQNAQKSDSSF